MIYPILEAKAEKLLKDANSFIVPVNIMKCTEYLNLSVEEIDLESDISGFLALKGDSAVIGCNRSHGHERKRFTIAHELSHYVLHAQKSSPFFLDWQPTTTMMFRDASSSTGEYLKEREANAFAAALLMPKELVEKEAQELAALEVNDAVNKLAGIFEVSKQAMSIRLANLDIIDYNA